MQIAALPPVRKSIEVAATPERAFRIFTEDMARWWPVCDGHVGRRESILLEPRVGGRWLERTREGGEQPWGYVLAWNPPSGLVLAWQVRTDQTYDPSLVTEVEIGFTARGTGRTEVTVEHRKLERFGIEAEKSRQIFDGPGAWVGVLGAFAASVK